MNLLVEKFIIICYWCCLTKTIITIPCIREILDHTKLIGFHLMTIDFKRTFIQGEIICRRQTCEGRFVHLNRYHQPRDQPSRCSEVEQLSSQSAVSVWLWKMI